VELGISGGTGIEADPAARRADESLRAGTAHRAVTGATVTKQRPGTAHRAVTEHIMSAAGQAGHGAALIDTVAHGPGGASAITWPQFAHMVRAAACGLSRRGLQEGDTAGIMVADAASHAVAVHAVRAAGAVAVPVGPAQTAADIAVQRKECRARMLITSAPLADLAIQAAERCWVRQVIAFGEAEGTTSFASLLHTARPGCTGHDASHGEAQAARGLAGAGAGGAGLSDENAAGAGLGRHRGPGGLTHRDVVVAAPPCGDPDAYTALLDEVLAAGATIVAAPLPQVAAAVSAYQGTAVITPCGTDVPFLPASRVFTLG
jgi:AMP-binding enzyme